MFGLTEILVIAAVILVVFLTVYWIRAVLDCAQNESPEDNDKIIWILIILLLGWLGAALYNRIRRPQRIGGQNPAG